MKLQWKQFIVRKYYAGKETIMKVAISFEYYGGEDEFEIFTSNHFVF